MLLKINGDMFYQFPSSCCVFVSIGVAMHKRKTQEENSNCTQVLLYYTYIFLLCMTLHAKGAELDYLNKFIVIYKTQILAFIIANQYSPGH